MPVIRYGLKKENAHSQNSFDMEMLLCRQLLLHSGCSPMISADLKSSSGDKQKSVFINLHNKSYYTQTRRGISRDPKSYFIKNAHSNEWVNAEILAAKLAGITGIVVPWTIFAQGFEHSPVFSNVIHKRKDIDTKGNVPFYFIASQRLEGYHDIANLPAFVNNYKKVLLKNEDTKSFERVYQELLNLKKGDFKSVADYKLKRRDLIVDIYRLLPSKFHDALEELYAVSMWLGNWDFLNFDMENCGFSIRIENEEILVEPAQVDFGDSLFTGFKGKHKNQSLEEANKAAKSKQTHPGDEDPGVDDEHKISQGAASFSREIEMLRLSGVPRRLPFEPFFEELDKSIGGFLEAKKEERSVPLVSKGFIRGLYRLSLLNDKAIASVLEQWYLLGDKINFSSEVHLTKEDLASKLKARKNRICELFYEQLVEYEKSFPDEARITRKELRNATLDIAGVETDVSVGKFQQSLLDEREVSHINAKMRW